MALEKSFGLFPEFGESGDRSSAMRAYARKSVKWRGRDTALQSAALEADLREYREVGFDGLVDVRLGGSSPRWTPVATLERMPARLRKKYFDFHVSHLWRSCTRCTRWGVKLYMAEEFVAGSGKGFQEPLPQEGFT